MQSEAKKYLGLKPEFLTIHQTINPTVFCVKKQKPSSVKEKGFNYLQLLVRPDLQVRSSREPAVVRCP
jgi:hypothetical protein